MTPVLYYHRVGPFRDGAPRKMTVTPENFRRQMEYLRGRKYAFVGLDQIDSAKKAVAVTFDDGFRDLIEFALPVLKELSIPATFFLVAGAAGKVDTWYRAEEKILDWDEARELAKLGFAIGSHSMTHATLDRVPLEAARREIFESKRVIEEKLGAPVRHFAYPQGKHTEAIMEMVREAGYAEAWGTKSASGLPFARRRFRVAATTGMLGFAAKMVKIRLGYY